MSKPVIYAKAFGLIVVLLLGLAYEALALLSLAITKPKDAHQVFLNIHSYVAKQFATLPEALNKQRK